MKKIITIMVCGLMFVNVAMADIYNTSIYSGQSTMYQGSLSGGYSGGSSYSGSVRSGRSSFSGHSSSSSSGAYSRFASALGGSSSSSSSSGGFGSSFTVSTVFGGNSSAYGSSGSSSGSSSFLGTCFSVLGIGGGETDGETMKDFYQALCGTNVSNNEFDPDGDVVGEPLGDAVIPLLLLISLVAYFKWRKM